MIPNDVDCSITDGERQFYRLSGSPGPDSRYLSWYLPDIKGKEPDFLLLRRGGPRHLRGQGLDPWSRSARPTPSTSFWDMGGKTEKRRNPQSGTRVLHRCHELLKRGRRPSPPTPLQGQGEDPCELRRRLPQHQQVRVQAEGPPQGHRPRQDLLLATTCTPSRTTGLDPSGRCFLEALKRMFVPSSASTSQTGNSSASRACSSLCASSCPTGAPKRSAKRTGAASRSGPQPGGPGPQDRGRPPNRHGPSGCGKTSFFVHRAALSLA